MPTLNVRYFAGSRAAAGISSETVEADSVDAAIAIICSRHDTRFTSVLKACSLLLDGVQVSDAHAALATDGELDVLPPFAGG